MMSDVRWTAKLPMMLAGLTLVAAGLFASSRHAAVTAIIVVVLGAAFVGYSLTIKDWCAAKASWGNAGFGQHAFGQCLLAKGYFAF